MSSGEVVQRDDGEIDLNKESVRVMKRWPCLTNTSFLQVCIHFPLILVRFLAIWTVSSSEGLLSKMSHAGG